MLRPYPPFNDFLTSSLCLGLIFAFGLLSPLDIVFELPTNTMVILYMMTILLVIIGMYQLLFRAATVKVSGSILLMLALLPATFPTAFPELLAWAMGSWIFDTDQVKYFNAWYALVVATISFAWAYWDSHIQLQRYKEQPAETFCLMTFNVFLSDHSFEPKEEIRGIWMLAISLVLMGFVMICLFVLPTISVNIQDLKMLIAKIAAMIPTGFIVGAIFLFLGQAIHLIKLERKSGRTLELRDFNERLRWRHDYVKYHMPAPVRKLNLRLFNQHVETYERLQKQTKASRT